MVDPAWPIKLNDGTWPENSALLKWSALCFRNLPKFGLHVCRSALWAEVMAKMGHQADCPRYYKEQMIAAGFSNVTEKIYMWVLSELEGLCSFTNIVDMIQRSK